MAVRHAAQHPGPASPTNTNAARPPGSARTSATPALRPRRGATTCTSPWPAPGPTAASRASTSRCACAHSVMLRQRPGPAFQTADLLSRSHHTERGPWRARRVRWTGGSASQHVAQPRQPLSDAGPQAKHAPWHPARRRAAARPNHRAWRMRSASAWCTPRGSARAPTMQTTPTAAGPSETPRTRRSARAQVCVFRTAPLTSLLHACGAAAAAMQTRAPHAL